MTEQNSIQEMVENVKNGILSKFPLLGSTMSTLKFEPTTDMETAATDGEKVIFNPEFMQKLPYEQKIFVFAHEIMHVAFDHLTRRKGKDSYCWNLATDSVINQMLKNANLPMPEGVVDIESANGKSAEEMYVVLEEKKQREKQNELKNNKDYQGNSQDGQSGNSNPQGGQSDGGSSQNGEGNQDQNDESFDDLQKKYDEKTLEGQHKSWDEAIKRDENTKQNGGDKKTPSDIEKQFSKKNQEYKKELARRIRASLNEEKYQIQHGGIGNGDETYMQYGKVGESKEIVSWKKILKKELEKDEDRWSYRRASEENDFQARIGSVQIPDRGETEVMLDVSGSVDDDFVKGFLRQLKPLLKHSKIKVGFFAGRATSDFQEIKSSKDIDNLRIIRPGMGTNMDAAVKAFSKSKHVNKIVFTDGEAGVMPSKETKNVNVIWLVYENENFNPCCGKVVYIDGYQLKQIKQMSNADEYSF